jgi:hypothetical protein
MEFSEAWTYLTKVRQAFTVRQSSAHAFIEQLRAAAQRDSTQKVKVVAHGPEELFLTFAGTGCYFRFVYAAEHGYIEFGQWATGSAGERIYNKTDWWEISNLKMYGPYMIHDAEQALYIALAAVMKRIASSHDPRATFPWTLSRHLLREFDDDANQAQPIASQSPPVP